MSLLRQALSQHIGSGRSILLGSPSIPALAPNENGIVPLIHDLMVPSNVNHRVRNASRWAQRQSRDFL